MMEVWAAALLNVNWCGVCEHWQIIRSCVFNTFLCRYFVVLPTKEVHSVALISGLTSCFCRRSVQGCGLPGDGGPKAQWEPKDPQDNVVQPRFSPMSSLWMHKGCIRACCRFETACSVLTWPFLSWEPIQNHLKRLFSGLEKGREKQWRKNQPSVPASCPLISLPEGLLYGSGSGVKAQCAAVLLARGFAVCEAFSCQEY